MKNFHFEFIAHLLLGVASIAFILVGVIILIVSFFAPLPMFNAVVLIGIGCTMFISVRLYFILRDVLDSVNEFLKQLQSQNSPQNQTPREIISINENTTPEEIEELKKKHPMIANELDKILNNMAKGENLLEGFFDSKGLFKKTKDIKEMTIVELKKALAKAVDDNEFEKAAQIRDEINSRK